jgi:hypothetical protein
VSFLLKAVIVVAVLFSLYFFAKLTIGWIIKVAVVCLIAWYVNAKFFKINSKKE